jgi:hypothetical protein
VTRPRIWYVRPQAFYALTLAQPHDFTFWVHNTDAVSHQMHYQLADVSSDGDPTNTVLRLNGLPPGEPVIGTLTLAPGDSAQVPVNVELDDFQLFTFHDVVLSADVDGDGVYDEYGSLPVGNLGAVDPTVSVPPATVLDLNRVAVSPNPFGRVTSVQFALANDARVRIDVYDVLGRRVRTLQDGRMPAGAQHVEWDGRDDAGMFRGGGVYFVRVVVADRTLTTKVVLMK